MNWVDAGVFALLLSGAALGFIRGLLHQIARLVTLPLSCYCAIYYHGWAFILLEPYMSDNLAGICSYVLVFLVVLLGLNIVLNLADAAMRTTSLKFYDRLLGAALGGIIGVFMSGMLLYGMAIFPVNGFDRSIKQSKTGVPLLQFTRSSAMLIPQSIRDRVKYTIDQLKKEASEEVEDIIEEKTENQLPLDSNKGDQEKVNNQEKEGE